MGTPRVGELYFNARGGEDVGVIPPLCRPLGRIPAAALQLICYQGGGRRVGNLHGIHNQNAAGLRPISAAASQPT